ncbi:MAG: AMP-binding protein [Faecousia sp.]
MFISRFLSDCINNISVSDSPAFSLYDGKELRDVSYRQFAEDVLGAAGYFRENYIQKRHIALAAPNGYPWIVVFFALLASGNIAVPVNPDLSKEKILRQCQKADAEILCADTVAISAWDSMGDSIRTLPFDILFHADAMPLAEVYSAQPEETILLMLTSGTTGTSKIAAYSSRNMQSFLTDSGEIVCALDTRSALFCLPWHHVFGSFSVLAWLYQYKTICVGRGIRYLLADIPVLNPSSVSVVPSVLDTLVKLLKNAKTPGERQKYIGSNLVSITVGGAGVNPALCHYMMALGITVQSAYGMTESAGAGTWCIWDAENMGSIGKPYGRTQCRIENGELLLKSPTMMKGYYQDPEETAQRIVDGWLHTGDMARCDENGFYYITGRKKNVIILPNGENVNPEEMEAALGSSEAIRECLVYGDGKGICANVYTTDKAEAMRYIKTYNNSVPTYHQVYKVFYSEVPLEKTDSGKIKRRHSEGQNSANK